MTITALTIPQPTAAIAHTGSTAPPLDAEARLAAIRVLHLRALNPMDPVGAMWTNSHLCQVEVPWLTEVLELALRRIQELEDGLTRVQPDDMPDSDALLRAVRR
ncbi:hypothetical protein [Arthrobacter sp. Soil762]|uniref:hypothetical protein n=1 Tax=Arthrobacter sp. Soil762 TaxID=1736401 RepID=UPI0006F7F680|nr:hypothetical protein [Arthrobacter sp. Soil762]KRE70989.1 hypothetical protein ASG77_12660 [Arthrobacter sp. Soil762]